MLAGKRILIIEDEPLIGLDLESAIKDGSGIVVGIVTTVATAMQTIENETLHGAILDLRLKNELALPLMEQLAARNIPFVIHSGQADHSIATAWPSVPIINKPALPENVIAALAVAIGDHR